MNKTPTPEMVSEIIIAEMAKWHLKDTQEQRRDKLMAMSDRIIRYFQFFEVTLPGLPGGRTLPNAPTI